MFTLKIGEDVRSIWLANVSKNLVAKNTTYVCSGEFVVRPLRCLPQSLNEILQQQKMFFFVMELTSSHHSEANPRCHKKQLTFSRGETALNERSGQFITTSAEVTLNGGLAGRECPKNPLNSRERCRKRFLKMQFCFHALPELQIGIVGRLLRLSLVLPWIKLFSHVACIITFCFLFLFFKKVLSSSSFCVSKWKEYQHHSTMVNNWTHQLCRIWGKPELFHSSHLSPSWICSFSRVELWFIDR